MAALLAVTPVKAETLTRLEGVDTNGVGTWQPSFPLVITGVLLNDPSEMLESEPNFIPWNTGLGAYQLGGQWQVFIQTVQAGDRGGVACWMGQNYGNLPWLHSGEWSYSDTAWDAEMARVNHDPDTGRAFQKGDLVRVTANGSLFYGGMQNINEEHSTDPGMDFTLSLLVPEYGLPAPEVISLASVFGTNLSSSGHYDLFDATRATGGEHWQGMRVRINGLNLISTNGWNSYSGWSGRICLAIDEAGRQIPLIHPLSDLGPAPTGRFDATGIFLQESGSSLDGTFGYKLFVQEIEASRQAELSIQMRPVISWPATLANYRLQESRTASPPQWTWVTNSPVAIEGKTAVVLDATAEQRIYRLERFQ